MQSCCKARRRRDGEAASASTASAGLGESSVMQQNWLEKVGTMLRMDGINQRAAAVAADTATSSSCDRNAYDWNASTQRNHKVDAESPDYGKFSAKYARIREALDAGFHGHYSLQRQALQDMLIADRLALGDSHATPWVIFTAGAMGAGKGRTMAWLSESGVIPLDRIVHVDPDDFKVAFPEWMEYCARDPLTAGFHTRQESGLCCEIAQEAALQRRAHVWVDGSLRDAAWYRLVFESIAERYPEYQIAIFHVVASENTVFERARERATATGRHVPSEEIVDSLARVPEAVEALAPFARIVAVVDNSSELPKLVDWRDRGAGSAGAHAAPSVTRRRHKGWHRMRRLFTSEASEAWSDVHGSAPSGLRLASALRLARWSGRALLGRPAASQVPPSAAATLTEEGTPLHVARGTGAMTGGRAGRGNQGGANTRTRTARRRWRSTLLFGGASAPTRAGPPCPPPARSEADRSDAGYTWPFAIPTTSTSTTLEC